MGGQCKSWCTTGIELGLSVLGWKVITMRNNYTNPGSLFHGEAKKFCANPRSMYTQFRITEWPCLWYMGKRIRKTLTRKLLVTRAHQIFFVRLAIIFALSSFFNLFKHTMSWRTWPYHDDKLFLKINLTVCNKVW